MMLECCYCSKVFKYESEKKRHEQSHTPQFECEECCKKFSFLSALRRHQKQHERKGTVGCNECGHSFRDNTLLKRHIKYAHKGIYECSKCNTKFNSDLALKSHMKIHKPIGERRYKCTYEGCDKSFNFQHHLKHHELIHTNARHHYCDLCGKGFVQAQHLKTHMKTHESWLHCTVSGCPKKFRTDNARNRHLITHKNIDSGISSDSHCDISQDSIEADTVLCETCGQTIPSFEYEKHESECLPKPALKVLPVKENPALELNNNYNNIEVFSNCKTVLGKCIANEKSPNSCLCAQINDANDFYDALLPNENFDPVPKDKSSTERSNTSSSNACDGCDCASIDPNFKINNTTNVPLLKNQRIQCLSSNSNLQSVNTSNEPTPQKLNDMPRLELRKDGAIKLTETCDITFDYKEEGKINVDELFNNNFVPYNSCKAVLGKCIVSGSGTISENCLCAKMAMDDHQMTQEIDEITPQPIK